MAGVIACRNTSASPPAASSVATHDTAARAPPRHRAEALRQNRAASEWRQRARSSASTFAIIARLLGIAISRRNNLYIDAPKCADIMTDASFHAYHRSYGICTPRNQMSEMRPCRPCPYMMPMKDACATISRPCLSSCLTPANISSRQHSDNRVCIASGRMTAHSSAVIAVNAASYHAIECRGRRKIARVFENGAPITRAWLSSRAQLSRPQHPPPRRSRRLKENGESVDWHVCRCRERI